MGHHILAKRRTSGEPQYSITLARFAARGFAAREVVQVHVHLAAVFDRRGCVAAEATTDGVGDDTWLGLGLGLEGFRDRDRAMVRVWSGLDERD